MSAELRRTLTGVGVALAAVVLTLGVAAGALALGGFDPVEAGRALWNGAFGSPRQFFSITVVRAVPLILTGLAVALAFRASLWNIGAEGQLYAGAAAAVAVGLAWGEAPAALLLPATLGAAALAGAAWAAIPALLKLRFGVGEVITTLLMNFVAIHGVAYLVHGPLQESRGVFPQSDSIPEAARLPTLFGELIGVSRLHAGVFLALLLAVTLWLVLRFTRFGFAVRAVGSSPEAAEVSGGIPATRVLLGVFLLSGALAGIGGGVEVGGVTYALYEDLSPGYGYTAIAVAILAGLHPVGVVATGLLFGALEGGASAMQRQAGVPSAWVDGVEALMILAVLLIDRGWAGIGWGALKSGASGSGPDGGSDGGSTGPEPRAARA